MKGGDGVILKSEGVVTRNNFRLLSRDWTRQLNWLEHYTRL